MCNICWFQGIKHGMFNGKEREYVSRLEDVIFYSGYHRLGWVSIWHGRGWDGVDILSGYLRGEGDVDMMSKWSVSIGKGLVAIKSTLGSTCKEAS